MRPTNLYFLHSSVNKIDKSIKGLLIKHVMKRESKNFDAYWDMHSLNDGMKEDVPPYEQLYWWVHLSCARWILFDP
jgi:hypothetical protein